MNFVLAKLLPFLACDVKSEERVAGQSNKGTKIKASVTTQLITIFL
jgi:hypothetical protein